MEFFIAMAIAWLLAGIVEIVTWNKRGNKHE
jgi:hypothetical protein